MLGYKNIHELRFSAIKAFVNACERGHDFAYMVVFEPLFADDVIERAVKNGDYGKAINYTIENHIQFIKDQFFTLDLEERCTSEQIMYIHKCYTELEMLLESYNELNEE